MFTKQKIMFVVLGMAALIAAGTTGGVAFARGDNTQPSHPQVLADEEVRQLVLLLDQDKNGKVSKQEFLKFMEAEFDRLDKDNSGELDTRELKLSSVRVSRFAVAGK